MEVDALWSARSFRLSQHQTPGPCSSSWHTAVRPETVMPFLCHRPCPVSLPRVEFVFVDAVHQSQGLPGQAEDEDEAGTSGRSWWRVSTRVGQVTSSTFTAQPSAPSLSLLRHAPFHPHSGRTRAPQAGPPWRPPTRAGRPHGAPCWRRSGATSRMACSGSPRCACSRDQQEGHRTG